jgi:SAM-dependent methyltransferase
VGTAAFPDASLTASDINRDGVDFCRARFGARPVYSEVEPAEIPIDESFDLIFVGSLLTHLDEPRSRRFLDFFCDRLAPDGLLVFSTHGRNAMRRWRYLDDERLAAIAADADSRGYGYREHRPGPGYGTSGSSPSWVLDQFYDRRDVSVILYTERGFADHQDMAAVMKLDVDHPQNARLNI